ncbi:uncharacterized protein [Temnothorax longispinosus]|uniref:uncharacterized protein isoform X1 n=1 Tax=Temnothorax longispinosus TaxID=300112 RepID=UPI003A99567B
MIRLEVQYFGLNKILLLAIGLWPHQQSKLTRFQFIFLSSILTTSIIFQLTSLITLRCTLDLVTKVVSSASFFTVYLIHYNSFCINIKTVKNLLMELQHIYDELKDEREIAIIKKYGYNAKRYTAVLTAAAVCGISFTIIVQCLVNMFDVALSVNISQPRRMQFVTEYFVDQEKYFFLILLHTNVAFCIGSAATIATGTMLLGYLQLIFGMFKISSYRIERAVKINISQDISLKNRISKSGNLMCAVDIHREAMRLSKYLVTRFETMFLSLTVIFIISLCFNFLRIFQVVSSKEAIEEAFFPISFVFINIFYLFICNFCGQNIIDHNNHVFITAYSVQWYVAPLHIQRMILFLLLKGAKDFTIIVGGILVSSIQCFATLVKASVSYFTVMLSMV